MTSDNGHCAASDAGSERVVACCFGMNSNVRTERQTNDEKGVTKASTSNAPPNLCSLLNPVNQNTDTRKSLNNTKGTEMENHDSLRNSSSLTAHKACGKEDCSRS